MTIKKDKYPNKADYKPYANKNATDETIDLPLADPSQSNTPRAYRTVPEDEGIDKPSAFAENKNSNRDQ